MAEIIRKEVIKLRNGELKRLCKKKNTNINSLAKETGLKEPTLRLFDHGKRPLTWERWEIITKYLDKLK